MSPGGGRGQGRFCNEQVWTGHQMSLAGVALVYSGEGVGFMFMWPIPWCMWCTYTPSTPVRMVGRHLWKHYLPATSLAGGNNIMALRIKLPADNYFLDANSNKHTLIHRHALLHPKTVPHPKLRPSKEISFWTGTDNENRSKTNSIFMFS